jgi:SAM-dependent methyltransferase
MMTTPPADPVDFFDDAYHRLLEPFHPEAEARYQVAALRELLGLAQDDRILDVGCGWGRHLNLLRGAGHDIVGVDLSFPLLRRARGVAVGDAGGVGGVGGVGAVSDRPALTVGDMRRLPFGDGSFDVVVNLATSLGLFLEDAAAVGALVEMGRVLAPGGRLLLDEMNGENVVAEYAERDGWTLEDGTEVRVRRRLGPSGRVSHEVLRWRGPGGEGEKRHSLRLRDATELAALAAAAGLAVRDVYGGWDGDPVTADSERLILLAGAGS